MQRILRFITILLFFTQWFIFPPSPAATSADLKKINHKIASIKAVLSKDQNKRVGYLKKLKQAETAASQVQFKLQKTKIALKKQLLILKKLNHDKEIYQTKLATQRQWLAQHIRSAYALGREPYLKLILNQDDAERIGRLLMYYRYLSQNHLSAIHDLQVTLTQLQNNQTDLQSQTHVLQKLQHQQRDERVRLEKLKNDRRQAISNLNHEIHTKNQRLEELLTNKRLLEQTLTRLEKGSQETMWQNFATLKGKLTWPTKGTVLPYFGTKIDQSELTWDGTLIRAPEDQAVYAVANGKVVFAKWLPGYGLLLIISHGHGYMTLYGRNHNLYKKPGDVVQKGDLVATVGRSGGYEKPALYFAIRHNAKPLNPSNWCVRK